MKKSSEIINSPVINISNGIEVGIVNDLVINPERSTVEFLTVTLNSNEDNSAIIAIPFKEALGVGEYAVTIENTSAFVDLNKLNIASDLLDKNVKIIDTKVLTRRGRLLGTVTEYMVDTNTGSIPLVTFLPQDSNKEKAISLKSIISFGQQVLVVIEDVENSLHEVSASPSPVEDTASPVQQEAEPVTISETTNDDPIVSTANLSSTDLFIEHQKEFMVGKKLKEDLVDFNGNLIAKEGDIITDDVFQKVCSLGRQKLVEMSMLFK